MRYHFFIFLLFSNALLAQQPVLKRSINWLPVKYQQMNGEVIYYLFFPNACYPDLNTLIPNYYELVKIENNFEYDVELADPLFEPFDNEEIKDIKHLNKVSSQIQVSTKVSYLKKQPYLEISFVPIRRNPLNNNLEKLTGFSIKLIPGPARKSLSASTGIHEYVSHSVLSSGRWFRIKIMEDGIYKLTYEDLVQIGISDPAALQIFGNGGMMLPVMNNIQHPDDLQENAIFFETGADGIFNAGDYVLFYGKGPHYWRYDSVNRFFHKVLHNFSDGSYYFLTSDLMNRKLVTVKPMESQPATRIVTSYDHVLHHELNERNLIASGSQWYGEHFDISTDQDFIFEIEGLIPAEPVRMELNVLARATDTTSFEIRANNNYLGRLRISGTNLSYYTAQHAFTARDTFRFLSSSEDVTINLQYNKNTSSAQGWLDYMKLNARSSLNMSSDQVFFRDIRSVGSGQVAEFHMSGATADTRIWDITDPANVKQMESTLTGNLLTFRFTSDELHEFVAFNGNGPFLKPILEGDDVGVVPNQDIHGRGQTNYIIISHPDFLSQARQLAGFRRDRDGLDTMVLTSQQVYNEFSSGAPDVAAIRNMLKMFYDRSTGDHDMPRYLLLFGDGSYDNISDDSRNTNFILTYQSTNSLSPTNSFVTDDFFGLLDDGEGGSSGLVDIGVGRLPVKTEEEAMTVIDKIIGYDNPGNKGDWRSTICFIGDDEDYNTHMRQADELATYVESHYPGFIISKIYLDAYQQIATSAGQKYPDVNEALNQRINKGALIINYTGHGGENGLAHERILEINDIVNWENDDKLPLFLTATCEFSRFDDYEHTSAGELVLLNPEGGGIALLSTTRLVYSGPNHALNVKFYEFVFEKNQDQGYRRLGDIIRLTKNASGSEVNKRSFTLLGDPAMLLNYPKYRIKAITINGKDISEETDTIRALGKVTITGLLEDDGGNMLESFNGTLYPTVFDKLSDITTLANDGGSPFNFSVRNRILFKGKASITDGEFAFSFIVPKDISYNYGQGKISFYGHDQSDDAGGSFTGMVIGGSADSIPDDSDGPEIRIFMNDDNFVFGGTTDENPTLLVYVVDSSGVNTIGSGIGHDLTAVIDDNNVNPIVLNDYYESDKDSYRSGKIIYPLRNLQEGPHKLKVKVWDVYNNSSEDYTEFIVTSSEDFILKNILNYPNPFTTHTSFYFEHNRAGSELDILIQIFTVSGKLVKTIDRQVLATGYRCGPIDWNGLDDFGSRIGRGVYIYRVKVRTDQGETVEKFEKLVILR